MYLDQFDRYVRTVLKPLAYLRYGDDFLLFYPRAQDVKQARRMATKKLKYLGLNVHKNNNHLIRSWQGLHFLGHVINSSETKVNRKVDKIIRHRVNLQNITSYSSLNVEESTRSLLPWLIDL